MIQANLSLPLHYLVYDAGHRRDQLRHEGTQIDKAIARGPQNHNGDREAVDVVLE